MRDEPTLCAVALGANVGDRRASILDAVREVGELPGTIVERVSELIETEPLPIRQEGPIAGGCYLNAAMVLRTGLPPEELLQGLHEIERRHGRDRQREGRWGARTLDLDLLTFGMRIIRTADLVVPHPGLRERLFVLEPLAQIAPELVVPGEGRDQLGTVSDLLARRRAREGSSG